MRGTEGKIERERLAVRITPADAGNSFIEIERLGLIADHPRGCGEQINFSHGLVKGLGSPPRMRGTALPMDERVSALRITPADAGNR